jgi:hypothetical protein
MQIQTDCVAADAVDNYEIASGCRRLKLMMLALCAAVICATTTRVETSEEWITLGERIHGGFGSFIPVGIRIGLDALQRLKRRSRVRLPSSTMTVISK